MDSLGFLWVGTSDGLCRYDTPQKTKIFRKGDIGLESSQIRTLHAGRNGNLWIGTTLGGVTRYHTTTNTSTTYANAPSDKHHLSNLEILDIQEISSEEVWIGTEDGLNVLYPQIDSIFHFPKTVDSTAQIGTKAVLDIFWDDKGWIWIGTWDGYFYLYLPNENGRHAQGQFRQFKLGDEVGAKHIWKIFQDSDGIYWIATHTAGLYAMQLPAEATNTQEAQDWAPNFVCFKHDANRATSISSSYVRDIIEDETGNLWFGTANGLNILSHMQRNKLVFHDPHIAGELPFSSQYYRPGDNQSLANSFMTTVYRDQQGLIWIGTISGLNQYNWYANQFERIQFSLDDISHNADVDLINSMEPIGDDLLALSTDQNGILLYNIKQKKLIKKAYLDLLPTSGRITQLHAEGQLLYTGTTSGVTRYDLHKHTRTIFDLAAIVEADNIYITSILKDSKGQLWASSEVGLFLIDEASGQIQLFSHDTNIPESLSDNSVTQVFEDSHQRIWVSTYNGLNLLTKIGADWQIKTFRRSDNNEDKNILSNQIYSIAAHSERVYFGCRNGLFYFDQDSQHFEIVEAERINFNIIGLQITSQGVLWSNTTEGILRYDLHSRELKVFGSDDGIGDIIFRIAGRCIGQDGQIYFGRNKGLIMVDDASLAHNETPPKVFLTDMRMINATSEVNDAIIQQERITLPADNYYLSLDFAALNYNQPEDNSYAYRLEGFGDEEWQYTDVQQAVYTNLAAGEYTFHVKAANNEGVWNETGSKLRITVKAAFVETIWFKLLILALAFIAFLVVNLLITRNIRNRNDLLEEYNERLNSQVNKTAAANAALEEREKRMKELLHKLDQSNKELLRSNKDLEQFAYVASHDLQEPLRTVGAFTSLLSRRYGDTFEAPASEYMSFITEGVGRMSQLIKSLLMYSQVGRPDLAFADTDLNQVVEAKVKDLSKKIADRNATVDWVNLPTIHCSGDQIGMVLYNLILNGIKFNKQAEPLIKITWSEDNTHWVIKVSDNGIGIAPQYQDQIFEIFKRLHVRRKYEGTGIGLALCSKIVHRHRGTIYLDSQPGEGTTFYFTIHKDIQHSTPQRLKDLTKKSRPPQKEASELAISSPQPRG